MGADDPHGMVMAELARLLPAPAPTRKPRSRTVPPTRKVAVKKPSRWMGWHAGSPRGSAPAAAPGWPRWA